MSLGALVVTKLVGTFALFFGFLVWQLVSVRRALLADREKGATQPVSRPPSRDP